MFNGCRHSIGYSFHIFIDRSVVEVFANERRSLTMRAYPALDESRLVSIRAAGYPVEVVKAEAWQLGSIYEHKTAEKAGK